ncbi:MAG: hypothetical protein ACRD25_03860 [Terracidiphilus sp.]
MRAAPATFAGAAGPLEVEACLYLPDAAGAFRPQGRTRRFDTGYPNGSGSVTLLPKRFDPTNSAYKMPGRTRIWRVVVPIVLIAAMLTMAVGVVCHSHTNCTPSTCPICHYLVAPSLAGPPQNVLIPLGEGPEPQPSHFVLCSARRQISARAPPA